MRLYLSSYRLGNQPEKLVELLGGKTKIAIIPNARDASPTDGRTERLARETDALTDLGLRPSILDLRDYFGKTQELSSALSHFDALWVLGGNCFVLRRAFRASGLDDILPELLATDNIVYAGYSAGIDQLIPSLRGAELVDDPNDIPEGYDPEIIWESLGLLSYAVAPHYKSDHPESAAIDKSVEYYIDHHIPFIALRDGQTIVRNGDTEEITN